jgi:hypothetical protein
MLEWRHTVKQLLTHDSLFNVAKEKARVCLNSSVQSLNPAGSHGHRTQDTPQAEVYVVGKRTFDLVIVLEHRRRDEVPICLRLQQKSEGMGNVE